VHNQDVFEPAADETANDVECADQQSDLKPQPVAPGQKLQGGDDDANDKGDRAPEDPAIAPVTLRRIGVCLPPDHRADRQRRDQPHGVAHKIVEHGYAFLFHHKLDAPILRTPFRRVIAGDRLRLTVAGRSHA
jgi:hypothetical protein